MIVAIAAGAVGAMCVFILARCAAGAAKCIWSSFRNWMGLWP